MASITPISNGYFYCTPHLYFLSIFFPKCRIPQKEGKPLLSKAGEGLKELPSKAKSRFIV
jgi:hypothetical protein